jgi:5'-nucleotidase
MINYGSKLLEQVLEEIKIEEHKYKGIIVVDTDEVIRKFVSQVTKIYNKEFPENQTNTDSLTAWSLSEYFPLIKDIQNYFDIIHPQEIYEHAEIYEGAQVFLLKLRELGYFVVLASAQIPENHQYTIAWYKKHKLVYDAICFTKDKSIFHADYLLDDGVHNLKSFRHGMPIAMDRGWNKEWRGARVSSFDEFIKFIIFSECR